MRDVYPAIVDVALAGLLSVPRDRFNGNKGRKEEGEQGKKFPGESVHGMMVSRTLVKARKVSGGFCERLSLGGTGANVGRTCTLMEEQRRGRRAALYTFRGSLHDVNPMRVQWFGSRHSSADGNQGAV
jgi:hypothetical protein